MKEIIELVRGEDKEDIIETIGGIFAWGGLFFICFMMSVIFG